MTAARSDFRLVLIPAVAALAAGALTALYVSGEIDARLRADSARMGDALTEAFAGAAQESLAAKNPFLAVSVVGRLSRQPQVREAWVADESGTLVASSDSAQVGHPEDADLLKTLRASQGAMVLPAGEVRVFGTVVRGGEHVLGFVGLRLSDQWASKASSQLSMLLWGGALLAGVAGALAGWWLRSVVRAARADVASVAEEAARAAARGELDRVSVSRTDEWGELSRSIVESLRRTPPAGPGETSA